MNLYSAISLVSFVISFLFGFYIFQFDPKNKTYVLYWLYSLNVSLLTFIEFILFTQTDYYQMYFWAKLSFLWPFMAPLFLHFVISYVNIKISFLTEIFMYLPALIFSIMDLNHIIYKVKYIYTTKGWIAQYYDASTFLVIIETFILVSYFIYGIFLLLKYLRKIKFKRVKNFYILFLTGLLFPLIYAVVFSVLQGFFEIASVDLTFASFAIGNVLIGFSILNYKIRTISVDIFYESLIKSLNNLLLILEKNIIVYANGYTLKELQLPHDEIIGKKIYHIIPFNDYKIIYNLLKNLKFGEVLKNLQSSFIDKKGNIHYVSGNITKVYDKMFKKELFLIVGTDISQQKQIEFELREAKELIEIADISKKSFINNLHHEIRTPLNSIIGFSELLLLDKENKRIEKELKIIHKSGIILNEYFDNLLEIANIEYKTIYTDYFSLEGLINEVKKIFKIVLIEKNIVFDIEIDKSVPPYLVGDKIKVKQILNHIINNSIKFTSSDPYVKLSITKEKEVNENVFLVFKVEDNGIGIGKEKLDKIFNLFEQGEYYLNKEYRGIGIGLFIVKKLINLLKGTIKIESAPGIGTTVIITLPFKKT